IGFIEGRNLAIEYRWADGHYDRLPALAADLARRSATVIITMGGDGSALAAKNATATIPIVVIVGDPVRGGLVSNLHHPGGNITGVSTYLEELEPKKLGLLQDLRPAAATIAVLVNPSNPGAERQIADIETAARTIGQKIEILNASTARDMETAFAKLSQIRADSLLVLTDPFFFNRTI